MLCQNCGKNEASLHMKRIVNGRAAEVHLCYDCARSLGYGDMFTGPGAVMGDFFGDILDRFDTREIAGNAVRCPVCGKTFEEIVSGGKLGCAECYNTFYERLLPLLRKIHGKTDHEGKVPKELRAENNGSSDVDSLKEELQKAIAAQDYERAALLRDRIKELLKGEKPQ